MKTIALIYPKVEFKENYPCTWVPFSLLAIASELPRDIFKVYIFDEHQQTAEQMCQQIANDYVLIIGISIMTGGRQIENGLKIARLLRGLHSEAVTVFGGPHANVLPEQTVKCDLVDYAVCGPGQESFAMLAAALNEGGIIDNIPGIYYQKKDEIIKPKKLRACIKALSPYPFDMIDSSRYIKYDSTIATKTLNYISSQGCPYGCSFCYENVYGRKYYRIDTQYICQDIILFAEQLNVTGIKFYDADFFINEKSYHIIIDCLSSYGISWAASIHPSDILRYQKGCRNLLLERLARSGCTRLLMGMESGSDRILSEVIHKGVCAKDYITIARAISEYGILGSYTFMVGFPDESEQECASTFELIENLWKFNSPIETKVHIYTPYPGTPLYSKAILRGHAPPERLEDWSDYNYYKCMTPWTTKELEKRASLYTRMINKKEILA